MDKQQAVAEAFLYCDGFWPVRFTSGVMFWMGQRVTLKDFAEYRELVYGTPQQQERSSG